MNRFTQVQVPNTITSLKNKRMSVSDTSKQIKEGLPFFALMKYSFQFEIETEGGKLRTTVLAEDNVGSRVKVY
ncbi:hypothetical protein NC651_038147 [Populus alba x Populus x berolinensis]|nr:hypothetical protein NC651_038147 [Populus alba x Populus x berolinensis]